MHLDPFYDFQSWRADLAIQELFEVLHVTQLARLGNADAILEPLFPVELDGLFCGPAHSSEKHVSGDARASSAFACVAMNNSHVFAALAQVNIHVVTHVEEDVDRRRVVVFPLVAYNLAFELLLVVDPIANVDHSVVLSVLFLEELCDFTDLVPEVRLNSARREAHCQNVVLRTG